MTDTPAHRAGFAARSGDTHVIGKDGKAVNIDQLARDKASAAARPKKRTKPSTPKRPKRKPAAKPTPASSPAPGAN